MKSADRVIITILLILNLAACASPKVEISVRDAWVRTSVVDSPMGDIIHLGDSTAYMLIQNDGSQADTLTGAESLAARNIEIHQTTMVNNFPSMLPVASVLIPANSKVRLEDSTYHLMLIDLKEDLISREEIEIVLIFELAGRIPVKVVVRE